MDATADPSLPWVIAGTAAILGAHLLAFVLVVRGVIWLLAASDAEPVAPEDDDGGIGPAAPAPPPDAPRGARRAVRSRHGSRRPPGTHRRPARVPARRRPRAPA